MKEYDLTIIGGGPGGYVAAIRAAQKGACVCLVEQDAVGGTCLNRGCIPTKALYRSAHLLELVRSADAHGIGVGNIDFDFSRAAARKDEVVGKLVSGVEGLLKANGVELIRGHAALEGEGRVRIHRRDLTAHIRTRKVILATGSVPVRPETLPVDGKIILTSDEILAIKELPESLLIIGGGYIGCEFASIFASFGTEVTLVEQLPVILPHTDRQAAREVEKRFKELGVTLFTDRTVEELKAEGDQAVARIEGEQPRPFSRALVAVGRRSNTEGLELESQGIELKEGAVVVDDRMQTSHEDIYAIGDVTGKMLLAHVASYQAGIAVENALGGDARADYRVVPSTIFTLPEIGQVGLTEKQCKEKEIRARIGRFSYQVSSKALCDGEARGMVKLVTDEQGKLLGATIVGEEASALIAEAALALQQQMTAAELGALIHSHPTLPEMVMEAAEDVEGLAVHKAGRRNRNRSD